MPRSTLADYRAARKCLSHRWKVSSLRFSTKCVSSSRPQRILFSRSLFVDSLFLIGGGDFHHPPTAEVTTFDVVEKRQRNVPRMTQARCRCAVTSTTRMILVCGGCSGRWRSLSSCELFQPAGRRWFLMPAMETARLDFRVVWLPDGRIFAIGGWDGIQLDSVEMLYRDWAFDGETTGTWRQCSPMLAARDDFAAVALHGEVVLVAGGCMSSGEWLDVVDLFTPPPAAGNPHALGQWTNLQPMQSAPRSWSIGVFSGGVVFIFERKSSKIRRFRPSLTNANVSSLLIFCQYGVYFLLIVILRQIYKVLFPFSLTAR